MLDVQIPINYLRENERLIMPHYRPIMSPSNTSIFTETEWNNYVWIPSSNDPDDSVNPNASPKPTWAELVQADIDAYMQGFSISVLDDPDDRRNLRRNVESLITEAAYGGRSTSHEEHIKSRLDQTELLSRMNHTRDHYRQRYHEIKHWVKSIPNTESGRQSAKAWNSSMYIRRYRKWDTTQAFKDLFTGARWTPPGEAQPYAAHSGIPVYQHHDPGTPPFDLELTVDPAVANDAGDQVMALHIFATAKATFTLTYPTEAAIHADREATGSPLTEVDSAKPHGCTTTLWIKRRAGDTGDREMTAEISVFASPYGMLNGARTSVTFPAGG